MLAKSAALALLLAAGPAGGPTPAPAAAPAGATAGTPVAATPATPAAPGSAPAAAAVPAPASAEATALARRVQRFYESTRDLRARFVQTYTYAALGRRQVSKGTLEVKKPGRMRWDYASPSTKTIAVNGSRLVQWEPEANQAFVDDRFDATAMSAAVTFLLGKGSLEKEFLLSAGPDGALVLHPRQPDPRVETVTLTVGPEGEVTRTRVVDGQGNVNDLAFEEIRRNVGIPDARFTVEIPADARRLSLPGK
ncbi:MAG TPA: outer membrane lipoprotein carrier protein LolA [Anaeromyxobacteraceae bacterium]|nr:outer membrane lipoprotein carrier protein LolA [Anaeromyxobacteraceae bacterium]